MANKLFMAGVANVDMFDGENLFGTATTLTESSLNIGISAEDIRGGKGAGLLGKYFHTSTFELTLTDALFSLEYIAASIGSDVDAASDVLTIESHDVAASGTTITLTKAAKPIKCKTGSSVYAWVRKANETTWERYSVSGTPANTITLSSAPSVATTYCVKYFYNNESARKITVKQDYVPKTLHLVVKETLYAAGETDGTQTEAGYILIDIPRFQLDGTQDLSMSMTGASTTSLKGSALATDGCSAGCDSSAYYATITEVVTGDSWVNYVAGVTSEQATYTGGAAMTIYATFNDGRNPLKITADRLTDTIKLGSSSTETGTYTALTGVTAPTTTGATYIALVKIDGTDVTKIGTATQVTIS